MLPCAERWPLFAFAVANCDKISNYLFYLNLT